MGGVHHMQSIRGIYLLKLCARIILYVGWCFVRILIWSSIFGMRGYVVKVLARAQTNPKKKISMELGLKED